MQEKNLNETVRKLVSRYGEAKTRQLLKNQFSDPDKILAFGKFFFPEYFTADVAPFHVEITDAFWNTEEPLAIAAPRGFAKSTVITMLNVVWAMLYEKYHFIIVISDTFGQAQEFVDGIKHELETNAVLRWVYGDLTTDDDWSKLRLTTRTGVRLMPRGQGMKIRGLKFRQYRPELIVIDDLENEEVVASLERRKKLKNWFLKAMRPAIAKGGKIVMIGTILHWDSLLKNILDGKEEFASWRAMKFKALRTVKDKLVTLWPKRYTVAELEAMKSDPKNPDYVGSLVFSQEFMNEPRNEEDTIIKQNWLRWYENKELPKNQEGKVVFDLKVMAIDPAIGKKERNDFTAMGVAGVRFIEDELPIFYIRDAINKKLSFKETIAEAKQMHGKWKPEILVVEKVAYQEALRESLEDLNAMEITPDGDKVRRLIKTSKYFEAGRVRFLREHEVIETLAEQLINFTGRDDMNDDLVDMLVYLILAATDEREEFIFESV